jgi:hypothetical protein
MVPQTEIGGTVGNFYTRAAFFTSSRLDESEALERGHTATGITSQHTA